MCPTSLTPVRGPGVQKEERARTPYTDDPRSMMHVVYDCVHFVCRKPPSSAGAGAGMHAAEAITAASTSLADAAPPPPPPLLGGKRFQPLLGVGDGFRRDFPRAAE